jgi:hypothetical protein
MRDNRREDLLIDVQALKENLRIGDVLAWLEIAYPEGRRLPRIKCPLPEHEEKTASCVIFTATDSWWCFGCQQGGDAIDLVRLVEGLSFPQAAEWVAERLGTVLGASTGQQRASPLPTVEAVAAQAHADVREWAYVLPASIEQVDTIFGEYDAIMRQWDAREVEDQDAIIQLLDWRRKWRSELNN